MEQFFDNFSKKLANTISRRNLVSVAGRSLLTSLVTSGPMGKLWASDKRFVDSDDDFFRCEKCLRCEKKSGNCEECRNPLTGFRLHARALKYNPYRQLQSFISNQFSSVGESEALVMVNTNQTRGAVLSTSYSGDDPKVIARLYFATTESGTSAFAFTFAGNTPQFGYFFDSNGTMQQILPPTWNLSTATNEGAAERTRSSVSNAGVRDAALASRRSADSIGCSDWCLALCSLATNSESTACLDGVVEGCTEWGFATLQPEIIPVCIGLGASLCYLASGGTCTGICEASTSGGTGGVCGIPPQQHCNSILCGTCQTCSSTGNCVPVSCPSGYSCSGTTGTCTCDNFCVDSCCVSGQTCSNGICTGCPTGRIACGSTCCSSGQTCSDGQCVINNCPAGYSPCPPTQGGSANGSNCCQAGEVCCGPNELGQYGCGPVGYICCGSGACAPDMTCCIIGNSQACCGAGLTCCSSADGNASCC